MNAASMEWNQSSIAVENMTLGCLVALLEARMALLQRRLALKPSDLETDRLLEEKTILARARRQLLEGA